MFCVERAAALPPRRAAATSTPPPRRRAAAAPPRPVGATKGMVMAALPSIVFRQGCHHQSPGTTHGETQASVLPGASGPSPKGRNGRSQRGGGATPRKGNAPRGNKKKKRCSFGLLFWLACVLLVMLPTTEMFYRCLCVELTCRSERAD